MKKIIALIGSDGQLGTDLVKVLSEDESFSLSPLTHKDIEITQSESILKTLNSISPDIVITTAAYHRVDEIETNPQQAFLVNASATKMLSEYCKEREQTLVFFSTDYVFGLDKDRKKPYRETDCPGPVSSYGLSKLAGEYFVRYINPKHFVVRTSGLFGIAGSSGKGGNFVETIISLAKKERKVKVVNDQILTPTYTMELARQVRELIKKEAFGLYHATAQGECSWYEFTKEIFRLLNMDVVIKPTTSEKIARAAKRPSYSLLENYNLKKLGIDIMSDWRLGLKEYLKEKEYI